jgi:hypothetical protein
MAVQATPVMAEMGRLAMKNAGGKAAAAGQGLLSPMAMMGKVESVDYRQAVAAVAAVVITRAPGGPVVLVARRV